MKKLTFTVAVCNAEAIHIIGTRMYMLANAYSAGQKHCELSTGLLVRGRWADNVLKRTVTKHVQ